MESSFLSIIIPVAVYLLFDIYAYQAFRSAFKNISPRKKLIIQIVYWVLSAVVVVFIVSALATAMRSWSRALSAFMGAYLTIVIITKVFIAVFLLIEDFVRLIRWIVSLFSRSQLPRTTQASAGGEAARTWKFPGEKIKRSQFIGRSILLLGAFPFVSFIYGVLRQAYHYKIYRHTVSVNGLPAAFNGFRILQISDIHSGSFYNKEPVLRGIEMINNEDVDLVVFTGDIVNDRANEMDDYMDLFKLIKSKSLILSITGNHDYGDYAVWDNEKSKQENFERLTHVHRDLGWRLLLNENYVFEKEGEKLVFVGVENWSRSKRYKSYGNLKKALEGVENIPHKILLSHDPSHWNAEVTEKHPDIFLTLSGHTHGFQFGVEIPGIKWSPAQWVYKQWAGLYKEGEQYINVNRGFGFIGYPGRVGILPEITVIELKSV